MPAASLTFPFPLWTPILNTTMERAMERNLIDGADPRVFSTTPDNPEDGRTFVWAKARWYQRVEGSLNEAVFQPLGDSTSDLGQVLSADEMDRLDELDPADSEYARAVRRAFLEQAPLYPEAPELSNQPFTDEPG